MNGNSLIYKGHCKHQYSLKKNDKIYRVARKKSVVQASDCFRECEEEKIYMTNHIKAWEHNCVENKYC